MLINIWGTILHLTDAGFSHPAEQAKKSLSLTVAEATEKKALHRQTWMVRTQIASEGSTLRLHDIAYGCIHSSVESYLLLTPGFQDTIAGIPPTVSADVIQRIAAMAKIHNKTTLVPLLGIPPECPEEHARTIHALNEELQEVQAERFHVVDLTTISYTPWTPAGSRPTSMEEASEILADSIMRAHASYDTWARLHAANGNL